MIEPKYNGIDTRAYYTILLIVWTTESFYKRMLKQKNQFFLDET